MPGQVTTTRTFTNTTSRQARTCRLGHRAGRLARSRSARASSSVNAGQSATFTVTITSDAPLGDQQFGEIVLIGHEGRRPCTCRWPSSTSRARSASTSRAPRTRSPYGGPTDVRRRRHQPGLRRPRRSTCPTVANSKLKIVERRPAPRSAPNGKSATGPSVTLAGAAARRPAVDPGASSAGLPAAGRCSGSPRSPIGDEEILNFNVPAFEYNGVTYTVDRRRLQRLPRGRWRHVRGQQLLQPADRAERRLRPNNVLAPFWTDLDGTGAPGILAGDPDRRRRATGSSSSTGSTSSGRPASGTFQVWIGVNGVAGHHLRLRPGGLPADPAGQDFLVGAENEIGQGDMAATLPTRRPASSPRRTRPPARARATR